MKKRKTANQAQILSPENYIRQKSRNLPLGKCFITPDWEEQKMAQLIITREHVTGNVTACFYLVDLGCLGVKDTMYKFNVPYDEIEDHMAFQKEQGAQLMEVPYELAHNIILASIEYAEVYGFKPHKDFTSITAHFLEEDTDDIPLIDIPCGGENGKPLYVNTGFDSPASEKQILARLEKTAGKGNYHIMHQGDGNEDGVEEEEEENELDEMIETFELLDKDEQKKMLIELIEKGESDTLSEYDAKSIIALIEILSSDMVSTEAIGEQLVVLEKKFEHTIVGEEELPNSLFTGVQNMDGENVTDLFAKTIHRIIENEQPRKALETFRKEVGDVPVIDFLELLFLEQKKSKKFKKKLEEAAQKHPSYFLIQVFYHTVLFNEETDTIRAKLEELWSNENKPMTRYETNSFFQLYADQITMDKNTDLVFILAFENFIENFNGITDDVFFSIITITQLAKTRIIIDHLKQTRDLKELDTMN